METLTKHQVTYRIHNERNEPPRAYDIEATRAQLQQLLDEGYLVRERLIAGEMLETLRAAADEIEAQELKQREAGQSGGFGGLFVRHLLNLHPAFLQMLDFAPTVSLARAVLGPQVQVHAFLLRVAYPELENQRVEWHFHQRIVPEPQPPWFARPVVLDNLIYLDDITFESGPLVVLPRTHRLDEDLPSGDHGDKNGQVVVTVPAGSCVTSHSSLWHKAMPTLPGGGKRRLLILGYSPVWMKPCDRISGPLTDELLSNADPQTRELLGVAGHF